MGEVLFLSAKYFRDQKLDYYSLSQFHCDKKNVSLNQFQMC